MMQRRDFLTLGLAGLGTTLVLSSPAPAQFIPKVSTKKWAILYGTWCGTARDAGMWISEGMGGIAAVIDIRQVPAALNPNLVAVQQQHPDLFDTSSLDPSTFDYLIIGTSIHGGRGPAVLDAYITKNIDRIQSKIRGHFAVCGNRKVMPGPAQVTQYIDQYLASICKTSSLPNRVFGGRITKSLMSDSDYTIYGSGTGEYDNLSRSECMKLGKEILTANT
jgi:menaquinone-dependent protoporphyrinogen IX oxidase